MSNPQKPKKAKDTQTQNIKNYFHEKIDGGTPTQTKNDAENLTNMALDNFQKGSNHKGWFNKLLKQVYLEKNLSTQNPVFVGKGTGISFKLLKDDTKPPVVPNAPSIPKDALTQTAPPGTPTIPTSPGALPQQQQPGFIQPPSMIVQKKLWTQEEKDELTRIFDKGLGFLGTVYKRTGLVKTKQVESNEPMDEAEFDKEIKELSKSWAEYCINHDIELPKWIELFMLGAWSFFVFGGPLISLFIGGKRSGQKPKEDSSLKDVGSKSTQANEKKSNNSSTQDVPDGDIVN